jgi:hypothetical protein
LRTVKFEGPYPLADLVFSIMNLLHPHWSFVEFSVKIQNNRLHRDGFNLLELLEDVEVGFEENLAFYHR